MQGQDRGILVIYEKLTQYYGAAATTQFSDLKARGRVAEKQRGVQREREREMLYFVGLGLGDEQDITLRGLEVVRGCHSVYLEAYTSLLCFGLGNSAISTLVSDRD